MSKDYGKQETEKLWEANPGRPTRTIKLANPNGEEDYEVEVPIAQWDYAHIVTFIIRSRYSADQMEAILNNQVADATSKHVAEFEEMQEWRKLAKRTAKEVLGIED
ncbi:MAG: hypothetical protein K6A94_00715 [Bacteroidales bacterium]|nr:hypothetical protein [Bacteroidales bacterium]